MPAESRIDATWVDENGDPRRGPPPSGRGSVRISAFRAAGRRQWIPGGKHRTAPSGWTGCRARRQGLRCGLQRPTFKRRRVEVRRREGMDNGRLVRAHAAYTLLSRNKSGLSFEQFRSPTPRPGLLRLGMKQNATSGDTGWTEKKAYPPGRSAGAVLGAAPSTCSHKGGMQEVATRTPALPSTSTATIPDPQRPRVPAKATGKAPSSFPPPSRCMRLSLDGGELARPGRGGDHGFGVGVAGPGDCASAVQWRG